MTPQEAAAGVLALVSGFAGRHALDRLFFMASVYQGYIDGSGTGSPHLLVLSGFIGTAAAWADLSNEWQCRLDHARLPYFKMKEMASSSRALEIAGFFYRAIEELKITTAISCAVPTETLRKVISETKWPASVTDLADLQNPFFLGFKGITVGVTQAQKNIGISEPIDFIFDNEGEKGKIFNGWDRLKLTARPEVQRLMGDPPIFRDDTKVPALQAADLFAWWVRKWTADGNLEALRIWSFRGVPTGR